MSTDGGLPFYVPCLSLSRSLSLCIIRHPLCTGEPRCIDLLNNIACPQSRDDNSMPPKEQASKRTPSCHETIHHDVSPSGYSISRPHPKLISNQSKNLGQKRKYAKPNRLGCGFKKRKGDQKGTGRDPENLTSIACPSTRRFHPA